VNPLAIDTIAPRPADADTVPPAAPPPPPGAAARFWLRQLFRCARFTPWVLRAMKPTAMFFTARCSQKIRHATRANARRLIGPTLTEGQYRDFTGSVIASFYDFVYDVGCCGTSRQELQERIESIEGRAEFVAHRREGRGAIIWTAHMGSFEVGLAALTEVEQNIHVVFKRDPSDHFETSRRQLRDTLGVREAPIDDGWGTWMKLRDALAANHVVVMQGDRAMAGQKAQAVPILGGHVLLPLGPVRLAEISGSPIVPVFTLRTKSGRCRVIAEAPVRIDPNAPAVDGIHPALVQLGKVLEKYLARYPEQWLVLDPAFVEDATNV
jgi:lauroyl/myristoyl acyltransferase